MAVEKIVVRLETLDLYGGTADPLYLVIITQLGGREFALRYEKSGVTFAAGARYEFGVNAPDLTADKQVYDSGDGGNNNLLIIHCEMLNAYTYEKNRALSQLIATMHQVSIMSLLLSASQTTLLLTGIIVTDLTAVDPLQFGWVTSSDKQSI